MKDASVAKQADSHTRSFSPELQKQSLNVGPFDAAGCWSMKDPAECGFMFAFHWGLILHHDIMSRVGIVWRELVKGNGKGSGKGTTEAAGRFDKGSDRGKAEPAMEATGSSDLRGARLFSDRLGLKVCFGLQWETFGVQDCVLAEINVQIRPIIVSRRRFLNIDDHAQRNISKPGEIMV